MTGLLLAAASLDVTPPPGHPLDGYAARTGVATGTADPLRATIIWLSTKDDPGVLWLTLDVVAAGTELTAELATAAATAAGIPPASVVVTASHTHSAPTGWTGQIHPVIPADREPDLYRALATTIATTPLPRRPVTASWHSTTVDGLGTNRHDPTGPHDNSTGILALRARPSARGASAISPLGAPAEDFSADGELLAVLLDFACHPTTYGPENLLWSADWPGATRAALEPVVVGFLQGAAGDISSRFTRQGRDADEVTRLGRILADRVREALAEPGQVLPSVAPKIHRTAVELKVRDLPTPAAADAEVASAEAELHAELVGPEHRVAQARLEGARGLRLLASASLPDRMRLPISVVTLGDVAWVNLPVELFAVHGARLQADSPYLVTRVIGYTDGYFGYVVDSAAAQSGQYEALMTYFDQPTTTTLLARTAEFLATTQAQAATS